MWSFGDGAGSDGDEVTHTFPLAGTYTVAVHASAGPSDVVSLLAVRVVSPLATITASDTKGVTIHNGSDTLLDLSAWRLSKGAESFVMPRYTTLLPGQDARFSTSVTQLGTSTALTKLLFPDGQDVTTFEVVVASTTPEPVSITDVIGPITLSEQETHPQPLVSRVGIQEVEEDTPQLVLNNSSIYDSQTLAPSTLAKPSVLGASAGSAVPNLLTSPWTASFVSLLVAAATILVIL